MYLCPCCHNVARDDLDFSDLNSQFPCPRCDENLVVNYDYIYEEDMSDEIGWFYLELVNEVSSL